MLKSKTQLRVAVKTAVIAAAGAGIFVAFPALAAIYAAPKPVAYTCTFAGAAAPSATHTFQMEITGPTSAVANSPLVATWKIAPPVAPAPTLPLAHPVRVRLGGRERGRRRGDADQCQSLGSPRRPPTGLRQILVTAAPPPPAERSPRLPWSSR